MARSRELRVVIAGDTTSLGRAFARASREAQGFEQRMGVVQRNVGRAFLTLGAGAGLGIGAAIKATVDFDRAMRNVNSIAGLNEKQFQALSKSVNGLAGRTAQAPKTLAAGMYDLVSSGFKAHDALKIIEVSAKAATAGLTTTDVSTRAVAAVLNAYRLKASDAAKVSDQLFQTVNLGVISFDTLANTIGDVLPFASSLGVGLNQVGAALSTMTKEGLSGEEATTRLKNVLVAFLKPSQDMAKAIQATGASSAETLLKHRGLQGALEAIIKTTDGTKSSVAKLFPNIRGLGGALALTGKNAKSAHGDLKNFADTTGATDRVFKEQSKSIALGWQRIKAQIQAAAITVGSALVPAFAKGLDAISGFVSGAKDALSGLVATFKGFREHGKSFSGALAATFVEGLKSIDWRGIGDTISEGFTAAMNFTDKLPAAITSGLSAAVAQVDGRKVLGKLVDIIGGALDALFSPSFWAEHFRAILSAVTIVIPVGKLLKIPGFSTLFRFISKPFFEAVQAVGRGLIGLFGRLGSRSITEFLAELEKTAPRLAGVLLSLVTLSGRSLSRLPRTLSAVARRAGAAVANALEDMVGAITRAITRWVTAGGRALARGVGAFGAAARRLGLGALKALDNRLGGIPSTIGHALGRGTAKILSWVGNFLRAGAEIGKAIVKGAVNAIKSAPSAIGDALKSLVPGPVRSALGKITGAIGSIFHAQGGLITSPTVIVGEEAPQHPEFVISTNPRDRARMIPLIAQAAKAMGVTGFQRGGVFSFGQLEQLWMQAGGRREAAPIMARIAQAESSGNPQARNPSGASGLWQILGLPFRGNPFDPVTNARMAIAKSGNGRNLHPWDASRAAWGRFIGTDEAPPAGGHTTVARHGSAQSQLDANDKELDKLRKQLRHLPTGKKFAGQRLTIRDRIAALVARNRDLREQRARQGKQKRPLTPAERAHQFYEDIGSLLKVDVAQAELTGDVSGQVTAAERQVKLIDSRLTTINRALKRKGLSRATKQRLVEEKATLLSEKAQTLGHIAELKTPPDTGGGDLGTGDGQDPNQALIDSNQALQDSIDRQNELEGQRLDAINALNESVKQQNALASSTVAIGLKEATRVLADMVSGELGAKIGNRALTASAGSTYRF